MGKKIAAISLALVMVLSFAACGEESPPAEEIIDSAMEAMVDMRTCQFDMEMSLDMAGEVEGESTDMEMEMDASGALDIENFQMEIAMNMHTAMTGEDDVDMEMEMYLVDYMFYIMTDVPLMGPTWMKLEIPEEMLEEIPEEYWEPTELMELQSEFLEAFDFEVTGSESVNGVDCYVMEVTADIAQLWESVMQQIEEIGLEMDDLPEDYEEIIEEVYSNFSVKMWIAKDTYFPAKIEVELAIELTPETMNFPGEVTANVTLTILMYGYNQPVSIDLPPEAEEAVEMPLEF